MSLKVELVKVNSLLIYSMRLSDRPELARIKEIAIGQNVQLPCTMVMLIDSNLLRICNVNNMADIEDLF